MQRHLRDQVRGGSQIMEEEDVMDAADIMREELGQGMNPNMELTPG